MRASHSAPFVALPEAGPFPISVFIPIPFQDETHSLVFLAFGFVAHSLQIHELPLAFCHDFRRG
jgi:hypothetical protein